MKKNILLLMILLMFSFSCIDSTLDEFHRAKTVRVGDKFVWQYEMQWFRSMGGDTITYYYPYYGSAMFVSFRASDSVIVKVWEGDY